MRDLLDNSPKEEERCRDQMRTLFTTLILASMAVVMFGCSRGPANYEDCILESMKGVSSDDAARLIREACRDKFPVGYGATPLSKKELKHIEFGTGHFSRATSKTENSSESASDAEKKPVYARMEVTARNTSDNLTITSLTIELNGGSIPTLREFTVDTNIKPRESGVIVFDISPPQEVLGWELSGAKATRR
jgi:hypothetical protein